MRAESLASSESSWTLQSANCSALRLVRCMRPEPASSVESVQMGSSRLLETVLQLQHASSTSELSILTEQHDATDGQALVSCCSNLQATLATVSQALEAAAHHPDSLGCANVLAPSGTFVSCVAVSSSCIVRKISAWGEAGNNGQACAWWPQASCSQLVWLQRVRRCDCLGHCNTLFHQW